MVVHKKCLSDKREGGITTYELDTFVCCPWGNISLYRQRRVIVCGHVHQFKQFPAKMSLTLDIFGMLPPKSSL